MNRFYTFHIKIPGLFKSEVIKLDLSISMQNSVTIIILIIFFIRLSKGFLTHFQHEVGPGLQFIASIVTLESLAISGKVVQDP